MMPGLLGGGANVDQFSIWDNLFDGFNDTTGRTVNNTLTNAHVSVVLGQSLTCNDIGVAHTPSNTGVVQNFNLYTGTIYNLADPVLGAQGTGGSFMGYLGDALINASVFARWVCCPIGIPGTSVLDWSSKGVLNHRLLAACRRVRSVVGRWPDSILWEQGFTDNVNGTSQTDYTSRLLDIIASAYGIGCDSPWLVAQESWNNGATSSAVRAAQAAVVDSVTVFSGPDTDTLNNTYRNADGIHFNTSGQSAVATLWKNAMEDVF
ncbi:MAG: hypothetical protein KGL39_12505 [Patescibacteria group bacterium]|nr:hypothetical protein [Patescibacteria group bacterium]